jgi:hypothetical protein
MLSPLLYWRQRVSLYLRLRSIHAVPSTGDREYFCICVSEVERNVEMFQSI